MKKLLIIASVVAVTCAAHAASFTWGFKSDSIQDPTGEYMDGGYAYLVLGATLSGTTVNMKDATILASGGMNADYTYGALSAPISSDALSSTAAGQSYLLVLTTASSAQELNGDILSIVYAGTSAQGVDPMSGDTWAQFENGTAFTSTAWKSNSFTAVPEPTSGLLMLLGMAGLALKRKRA